LEFDLREVLAALGDRALTSRWYARDRDYTSKDERNVTVMKAMAGGQEVNGRDLVSGIEQLPRAIFRFTYAGVVVA